MLGRIILCEDKALRHGEGTGQEWKLIRDARLWVSPVSAFECVETKPPCEKPGERRREKPLPAQRSHYASEHECLPLWLSFRASSEGVTGLTLAKENAPFGRIEEGSYQEVHHVGLVIPQRLHCMEDVDCPLVPEHLTDDADGAERPAAASPIPVRREIRWSRLLLCHILTCLPSPGEQVMVKASEAGDCSTRGQLF